MPTIHVFFLKPLGLCGTLHNPPLLNFHLILLRNVWTFLTVKFQISANISLPDPPSVFSSLSSGVVPAFCKKAVIEPLIKKAGLESTNVSNYHPISKSFYLKILENFGLLWRHMES